VADRISDERLASIDSALAFTGVNLLGPLNDEVRSLLAEVRERRAMDTNLRRLSDVVRGYYNRNGAAPTSTTLDLCDAIDKLLGGAA
jgi:hypothetical protein